MGEFLKILSDPTRLKILYALSLGELRVCDVGAAVDSTASAVSHQLSVLRQARLVAYRREGKSVYYRLNDEHVELVLDATRIHLAE